jgi:4-diphosphocytidyl-2-C-methyl-D-erythritol kinase
MSLELKSPCKINLLLNILGRRSDGFHELETVLQPVALHDMLRFEKGGKGIQLTCSDPSLPVDNSNLVHRAAIRFVESAGIRDGIRIHLEKNLPLAAGLGGGSANAAVTLEGLNALFDRPLSAQATNLIATTLGSDVPFFLQHKPALGTGRGEQIQSIEPFDILNGAAVLLLRPGFGVSTAWAYRALAGYPAVLQGRKGRAELLIELLKGADLQAVGPALFNSLETPVFNKYPFLSLVKEYLLDQGAAAALMSGSGSTTFAIARSVGAAESLRERVFARFGSTHWTAIAPF